jgi:hypothetical protein
VDNNSKIVPLQFEGINISVRESDGYVNLTQMCKAYDKRLDNWLRLKTSKAEMDALSDSLRSEESLLEVVKGKFSDSREQGTWGHPLLAVKVARWISPQLANWLDAHSYVLMSDGKTSLDIDPFERMQEILSDLRLDVDHAIAIDDRFEMVETYAHWSLEEGE